MRLVAVIDLGDRRAPYRVLHQVHEVGDIDPVARGGLAIGLDDDLGDRRFLEDRGFARARRLLQDADNLPADPAQLLEVFAIDAQHQRAVGAADHVVDPIDDGLADADLDAGQPRQPVAQLLNELGLGLMVRPGAVRGQAHARFDVRGRPWIATGVVATGLGDDVGDLGEGFDRPPEFAGDLAGLVQGQAGRHLHLHPKGAFVEVWQEFAADRRAQHHHGGQGDGPRRVGDGQMREQLRQ